MKFILQDDYKDMTLIRGDNNDYLLYSAKDDEDIFGFDNIFAESLALALLDDLGKGWKPYPENVPETDKYYLVTIDDVFNGIYVDAAQYIPAEDAWYSCYGIIQKEDGNVVVAYSELPAPFQPEEQ